MGTNFYTSDNRCKRCNQKLPEASEMESVHLGKSSAGWTFALQLNGKKYYKNWQEMKGWLVDKKIYDEYGREISLEDFIKRVEDKQRESKVDYGNCIFIDGYRFLDTDFS